MRLPLDALWSAVDLEHRFTRLTSFLAGLAAISPGTHSVEGEFSALKQIKIAQRSSMISYAIEGQLQAKQYFELLAMVNKVNNKADAETVTGDIGKG
ncbi:hypothetical protein PF005_g7068 [Phytophthora fragariae]|uniref:Uncharacterized protein n=3 Tax=Phytophthora TaxID=4783 RepID=A0A6A3T2S5_9STRA|nr:hypothetical protein PF003_g13867 [Phytophthora fragariae]KAE9090785.1 hypothetical protein PF010_g18458 [Phytophthora fragariae]KAE9128100.1 hypothetical protein PF007_g5386 [Phytophthora fragariae]KAE9211451.1 hypothetical protein PF004_g15917 [Phytophthora fragariae]KAE9221510.1 hypothetical protein PF005_g7068 [Phytophthora fragariae]